MKVVLTQAQRILMPAGSVVEVDAPTAEWLFGVGAAKPEEKKSVPKKTAKK